jgi:hypothetical protein
VIFRNPGAEQWPKPPRSLCHGGRPEVVIPALVIDLATRLHAAGAGWREVIRHLTLSGNGTYARTTIRRHVLAAARSKTRAAAGPTRRRRSARTPGPKPRQKGRT